MLFQAIYHVFDIAFTFNPALLAYDIVGGGLGVTTFGLIATRPHRDLAAGVSAVRGRVWVNTWTFASRPGTIAPSSQMSPSRSAIVNVPTPMPGIGAAMRPA